MVLEILPKIELQMLILNGQSIQNRLYILKKSSRGLRDRAKTDIELESIFWGVLAELIAEDTGPKAKSIAKRYRIAQEIKKLQNEETSIRIAFGEWLKEVEGFLARVSIKRRKLRSPGNSELLIRRFRRFNDYFKLETRVSHALQELGRISREDLIFNTELPEAESKEILLEPRRPFSALKALRDILADANRYVKILDPWVNVRSLDPLLNVKNSVKILFLCSHTGGKERNRFIRSAKSLKTEKQEFSIKKARGEEMHDRWIITDKGIWSLSQSMKDIGRKKTTALIAPHSKETRAKVESFFDALWKNAIEIVI